MGQTRYHHSAVSHPKGARIMVVAQINGLGNAFHTFTNCADFGENIACEANKPFTDRFNAQNQKRGTD
jgi:hypothetical protein